MMHTRGYMIDIAGHELKLLIQETQAAIRGLDRQRQSALQAIEAARFETTQATNAAKETDVAVAGLVEGVARLQKVLDDALREMDAMQAVQPAPESGELVAWPLWAKAPAEREALAYSDERV
jgi:hypothetical protein